MSNTERKWLFWLEEIRASIEKLETIKNEAGHEKFLQDFKFHDSALMNLANIGEFSLHIPDHIKEKYSHIEWKKIKGLRNVIAHDYPGVLLEDIWVTMQDDIPNLEKQILDIMTKEDR